MLLRFIITYSLLKINYIAFIVRSPGFSKKNQLHYNLQSKYRLRCILMILLYFKHTEINVYYFGTIQEELIIEYDGNIIHHSFTVTYKNTSLLYCLLTTTKKAECALSVLICIFKSS